MLISAERTEYNTCPVRHLGEDRIEVGAEYPERDQRQIWQIGSIYIGK